MNIVFLIRTLAFGGAERQLVALATGLHERGNNVKVVVFYPQGALEDDLRSAGIPVISLDKRGRWDILPFFLRTAQVLKEARPDIVHGYLGASNLFSLLFKPFHRGKSVWGVRASGMDSEELDWLNRFDGWIETRFANFADLIIANSVAGKQHAVSLGFPSHKTIVIPNGIDTDRFSPDSQAKTAIRAEFGIAPDEILIGRVGRVDPQKDHATFVRMAALVSAKEPKARFMCLGSGPAERIRELQRLAEELSISDKVIWVPARSDAPALYNAMDITVSSSAFGEGTPNVVAESMACGVPCVVTDVGDSALVLGDARFVVPASRPDLLAAKTLECIDLVRSGLVDREQLRSRIVYSLSMSALVTKSESALQALVSGYHRQGRRFRKASA